MLINLVNLNPLTGIGECKWKINKLNKNNLVELYEAAIFDHPYSFLQLASLSIGLKTVFC